MGLINSLKAGLLDAYFGGTPIGAPATLYIGLSTTAPLADGSGATEPVGDGYARVAVTNNVTNFPNASDANPAVKQNGTVITFPQVAAAGDWGTVTHGLVFTASTGGTPVGFGALATAKNPTAGDTPEIAVGGIDITIADV